jgi:hypothetical protein
MIQAGVVAAGTTVLAACTGSSDDDATPSSTTGGPPGTQAPSGQAIAPPGAVDDGVLSLFAEEDVNYEQLYAAGAAAYGASEVGEVITATANAGFDAGLQEAFDSFSDMSDLLDAEGSSAEEADHRVTARDRYLRSAEYLAGPLFFVLGTDAPDREPAVFTTLKDRWIKAGGLFDPVIEKVAIPYEGGTMPGYFLPALGGGPERRPTVIVNNGSDGQSVETYSWGGRAAQERGWNALLLEGPGQGEMLFEREVPFRPDWENVITPTIDYLVGRPDVDPEALALTGWSMGGILVSRAAAFEPRLRAVVTDPGAVDAWVAFPEALRSVSEAGDAATVNGIWTDDIIPGSTPEEKYTLSKRLEIFTAEALQQARQGQVPIDWYGLSRIIQQYRSDDVAPRITMPVLVIDYEGEQFYPGQAQQLYDLITAPKDLVRLDSTHGAQLHCAPMAPRYRNEVVYDWLDEQIR